MTMLINDWKNKMYVSSIEHRNKQIDYVEDGLNR